MKKINVDNIKKRNVKESEIIENKKDSKNKTIVFYFIPLSIAIIGAIIYFFTLNTIFLIIFGIALFITLFGWDNNSRICSNCGKWNSLIWIDQKRVTKTTYKKKKDIFGKEKEKAEVRKLVRMTGKCKNCGNTIEKESGKIF